MDNMSKAFFSNLGLPVKVVTSAESAAKAPKNEEEKKNSFENAILKGLLEAFEAE